MNVIVRLTKTLVAQFLLPLFTFLIVTPLTLFGKFLNSIAKKLEARLIEVENVDTTQAGAKVVSIYTGKATIKNTKKISTNDAKKDSASVYPGTSGFSFIRGERPTTNHKLQTSFCHTEQSEAQPQTTN
ncbi:MAG: hypothetical protein ABIO55_10185 [Ginsengibacter sp.]